MKTGNSFVEQLAKHACAVVEGQALTAEAGPAISGAAAARRWFEDLCKQQATGWAQFSAVNVWVDTGRTERAPEGILLAAELHVPRESTKEKRQDESHHLRHNGQEWIAVKITRKDQAGAFLQTRTLLHSDKPAKLGYEVAWAGTPLRPTAFRLIAPQCH